MSLINVNNPVTTATPTVKESSSNNPLITASPDILSSSVPVSSPTSSQSNIGNSSTLTLQSDFLKVSYVHYYSTDLKWSLVNGAKSYKIYQDGKLIADNITGLAYSVKNLTPNTDYTFEISAVNDVGESNKAVLKVRTFIPGNNSSSGSNNSGSNNATVTAPTPTANVQFDGVFN